MSFLYSLFFFSASNLLSGTRLDFTSQLALLFYSCFLILDCHFSLLCLSILFLFHANKCPPHAIALWPLRRFLFVSFNCSGFYSIFYLFCRQLCQLLLWMCYTKNGVAKTLKQNTTVLTTKNNSSHFNCTMNLPILVSSTFSFWTTWLNSMSSTLSLLKYKNLLSTFENLNLGALFLFFSTFLSSDRHTFLMNILALLTLPSPSLVTIAITNTRTLINDALNDCRNELKLMPHCRQTMDTAIITITTGCELYSFLVCVHPNDDLSGNFFFRLLWIFLYFCWSFFHHNNLTAIFLFHIFAM